MRYEVGFRFLKKKNSGKNGETVDLTDDEVRAKIGHALRDLSTVLRENGGDEGSPDSRVPRPGPYKKQDKQLHSDCSSESLDTLPTGNDTAEECDAKPAARIVSPPSAPVSSSFVDKTAFMATYQEEQKASKSKTAATPDQVRSLSPPIEQMANLPLSTDKTPLKSNQVKSLKKKLGGKDKENLKLFTLEVGDACESLLSPPPESLLPPLDYDDDLDEYWTHAELQNERSGHSRSGHSRSGRSHRTAMSIGTFELANERSGRSQRTAMSVGTFDMSLNSSCCLSDAVETISLVST
ncbi:MAG: hypothetical protein SGBAC_006806 [Bacillariaceae sp.]